MCTGLLGVHVAHRCTQVYTGVHVPGTCVVHECTCVCVHTHTGVHSTCTHVL
jgi:hypothetical protein